MDTKSHTLNTLKIGEVGMIKDLNCTGNIRRRLLDLGMVKGTRILPVLTSPSGGLTAYEIRNSIIAIRDEDSQNIMISSHFVET